ncbi:MAG TPA: hypothetical protein VFF27_10010 [Bacteroidia bacterium]|jgi:hypothetical protein|nr:hypothetical protein [Bacteroidia bacterium]
MQAVNQPTLWRLYTNTSFRREFLFDKEEFYQKYNIPVDIVHFLNDTSAHELANYAETLLMERMKNVKKQLPLTFRLVGKDIHVFFLKFCDSNSQHGTHKQEDDAPLFILYLLNNRRLSISFRNNLYARSILLYEQDQLLLARTGIPKGQYAHHYIHNPQHHMRVYRRRRRGVQYFPGTARSRNQSKRGTRRGGKKHITPFL